MRLHTEHLHIIGPTNLSSLDTPLLLGERVFVLDLVIILLLQIKIFVSSLAHLDLSSSTNCLCFILSDLVIPTET